MRGRRCSQIKEHELELVGSRCKSSAHAFPLQSCTADAKVGLKALDPPPHRWGCTKERPFCSFSFSLPLPPFHPPSPSLFTLGFLSLLLRDDSPVYICDFKCCRLKRHGGKEKSVEMLRRWCKTTNK